MSVCTALRFGPELGQWSKAPTPKRLDVVQFHPSPTSGLGEGPSFRAFREPILIRWGAAVFVPGVGEVCSYSATLPKRMEGQGRLCPGRIRPPLNRQLRPSPPKAGQPLTEGGMCLVNLNVWL